MGLKSGQVAKIFIDNPFPIELVKHTASIRWGAPGELVAAYKQAVEAMLDHSKGWLSLLEWREVGCNTVKRLQYSPNAQCSAASCE